MGVDQENKKLSSLPLLQVESIFLFVYKSLIMYPHIFLLSFFSALLAFSPTKEIDVSLGDTSLLAKMRVIIFRDMYILNV